MHFIFRCFSNSNKKFLAFTISVGSQKHKLLITPCKTRSEGKIIETLLQKVIVVHLVLVILLAIKSADAAKLLVPL